MVMFNSKVPSISVLPEKPLSIQGMDGIETFKIDENTIGVRPKWISVKERMPPNSVYVLVAVYDPRPNVEMYFIEIAERMNNNWFDGKDGDCIASKHSSVTHWMPLPDEPKE